RRRLPPAELRLRGGVSGTLEIARDRFGIPHVSAQTTPDLFYGLGLAMGQDRLWQMDVFRRRGQGRLAEILGSEHVISDLTHRTLQSESLAGRDAELLDESEMIALDAFVGGVNRALDESGGRLPIEFDLLGYAPEAWTVPQILTAARGFWWLLNGRLASIVAGEVGGRCLPAGPLLDAYLTPDDADETIVPGAATDGHAAFGADSTMTGSNNWAVGASRTASGAGVLGSDPHQPFAVPANWYECRLRGPEDDAVGAAWAGMPGLFFGRNRDIAWGLTNNNVSLRDLYMEEIHPEDPARYRDGDEWRRFSERPIAVTVRGGTRETMTVRATTRGPVVNHLIPAIEPTGDPPLSLRWVGQEPVANIGPLLRMNRARDWTGFRAALEPWAMPTFNWGFADRAGRAGYQCASRVPIRGRVTRGFRAANRPDDAWRGFIPCDEMPRIDPGVGFIVSANNPTVDADYPYAFTGAFASGERARRIRLTLEAARRFDAAACRTLQLDTYSLHADQVCGSLLNRTAGHADDEVRLFVEQIEGWPNRYELDQTGPAFYEMFMRLWSRRVAAERFPEHLLGLVTGQGSVVARLLANDDVPWFAGDKNEIILETIREAVREVKARFGEEPAGWAWGRIHLAHFTHPLSNEVLAPFVDFGPMSIAGTGTTVRNTGLGEAPLFHAASGAEYQLVADLGDDEGVLANQSQGQSGQPGSPHYGDQFPHWVAGDYHRVAFDRAAMEGERTVVVVIEPEATADQMRTTPAGAGGRDPGIPPPMPIVGGA
ncbi:MAG: penicillin acylase family protein, partial [Chloroflexia bacterium]|nr:penicillin acylase family protein [Chloroflexia bacterium]